MTKVKTLIMFSLIIALSFSLIGCGLIASRTTGPEEVAVESDEVPEWLQLSHRSAEGPESEMEDELESMEEEEPVAEATEESTQTAQAAETQQTAPSSSEQEAPAPEAEESADDPVIKPGTPEYNIYMQNRLPGESIEEFLERARKLKEKGEKEDKGHWFDDMDSPTKGTFSN